nr:hypothetical protein [Salinispora arenicola]
MTASTATIPASTKLVTRVNPFAGLTQSLTVAWRTLVRIKHNPADLADLSVQPIVFTLLFAFVFGGRDRREASRPTCSSSFRAYSSATCCSPPSPSGRGSTRT